MANVRCMFVGRGPSDLAEDRVVNTFHFISTDPYATSVVDASNAVAAFYNLPYPTNTVSGYLSPWVQRDAELRFYDLSLPKNERPPTVVPLTLNPPASGNGGLPEEVAMVLTLNGVGIVNRRRRGRLYIGPLLDNVCINASDTEPARPSPAFITTLTGAANALRTSAPGTLTWVIRSSLPVENFVIIGGGYVDDAFDTQRRRGPDASTRTVWP